MIVLSIIARHRAQSVADSSSRKIREKDATDSRKKRLGHKGRDRGRRREERPEGGGSEPDSEKVRSDTTFHLEGTARGFSCSYYYADQSF
jgi:hypothetical protein